MLKTQYPTDYLKKEGVSSEVAEPIEEQYIEQQIWKRRSVLKRLKRSDSDSTSKETREPISIFQEINQEKNRQKKQNLEEILSKLRNSYSNEFKIGVAVKTGDCFFDSVAQAIKQLKPKIEPDVRSLRAACKEFAVSQLDNDQS